MISYTVVFVIGIIRLGLNLQLVSLITFGCDCWTCFDVVCVERCVYTVVMEFVGCYVLLTLHNVVVR